MPVYIWHGIDYKGKKINGTAYANNRSEIKNKLNKQNICPLKIKNSVVFWHSGKIKQKYIITFIEQLAILINANIPLPTAFNIIAQDEKNESLKKLIITCKQSLFAGQSLQQTLRQHPQYFSDLLCSLINVGEQSGTLDSILNDLVDYFTKIAVQKRKIIKILLYPSILLIITFLVTIILLLFVIPQFKTMYSNLNANLPAYTRCIMQLGEFLQTYWIIIFSGITSIIICLKLIYQKSIQLQQYFDNLNLVVPLINKIITYTTIIRFTKTVSLAFKSGMPLLQAINIATNVIKNRNYQNAIKKVARSITDGKSLHKAMEKQKLFPITAIQLIALGEETGTLDTILEKIATIYNEKLNNITDNINNLLEPIIMLILSILVGGLIIGIYLPIFKLGATI